MKGEPAEEIGDELVSRWGNARFWAATRGTCVEKECAEGYGRCQVACRMRKDIPSRGLEMMLQENIAGLDGNRVGTKPYDYRTMHLSMHSTEHWHCSWAQRQQEHCTS